MEKYKVLTIPISELESALNQEAAEGYKLINSMLIKGVGLKLILEREGYKTKQKRSYKKK